MKHKTKTKAIIIGCGNIGCGLDNFSPGFVSTHLSAYKNNENVSLVGVCDLDLKKAREISEKNNIPFYSDNLIEIMGKTNPDVVSICVPDESHYGVFKKVVNFKCVKGIWCEKPIAVTLEQAEEMLATCNKKNIKLLINYYRRYDQFYKTIKKNLKNLVGEVQCVSGYYSGGIVTNGSHLIDLLCYFFGPCKSVYAAINKNENELNDLNCGLIFNENIFVNLSPCNNDNFSILELDIVGTNARLDIVVKPFGRYDYRYYVKQKDSLLNVEYIGNKTLNLIDKNMKRDYFEKELLDLLLSIDNNYMPQSCTNAVHVVEILSALVFSAQNKSVWVDLPFHEKKILIPKQQGDLKKWKNQRS